MWHRKPMLWCHTSFWCTKFKMTVYVCKHHFWLVFSLAYITPTVNRKTVITIIQYYATIEATGRIMARYRTEFLQFHKNSIHTGTFLVKEFYLKCQSLLHLEQSIMPIAEKNSVECGVLPVNALSYKWAECKNFT